ncbi:MAG: MerR family Zn(II)-responsive transcriptional regulator of zntA [bacterium]|jgi:MerR family Zn(II)-responsive transcriptional regulator of zntA
MKYFKIGELSKLTNISIDTIRYYEKMNLFTPTTRSDSGYRLYSKEDLQKIQFILRAKAVGFSLKEVLELLSLNFNKENQTCEDVKQFAEEKIKTIQYKIQELEQMKDALQNVANQCCGLDESASDCSILHSFE